MKETKEILKLIDDGKAIEILRKDNLMEKLNELHQYELIDIVGDKVVLTEKGRQAERDGSYRALKKSKRTQIAYDPAPGRTGKLLKYFKLLVLLALLFLASLLTLI